MAGRQIATGQTGDRITLPVRDPTTLPTIVEVAVPRDKSITSNSFQLISPAGEILALGQRAPGKLQANPPSDRDMMTFVLPACGGAAPIDAKVRPWDELGEQFSWTDQAPLFRELRLGDRPVLRYMYEPLDTSSPARIEETYKAYHHLFDPSGSFLVTKGPGGLYPHHRGLFYGFNRISFGDQQADVWHCRDREFQAHARFISEDVGPVYGRHKVQIDWHGRDGSVFASELRELTAYNVPNAQCVEFRSRLTTTLPHVRLDGDPQHAGFQFRASQFVPDHTAKLTYYLRPDGKGVPGSFRNWSNQANETEFNLRHVDLAWNALSFVLENERRFTCCYLDHPGNPKPARFSERDYGRFGSYFEYDLTPEKPLFVQYRIWIQEGEMTVEQVNELSRDFTRPSESPSE
jgi:hypothetical protein